MRRAVAETDRYIPRERWITNLVEAASAIADREAQENRWRAPDRFAWEHPDEVINVLMDDCVFELFVELYCGTFTQTQLASAMALRDRVKSLCDSAPHDLRPDEMLTNPDWNDVRASAQDCVAEFKDKWP